MSAFTMSSNVDKDLSRIAKKVTETENPRAVLLNADRDPGVTLKSCLTPDAPPLCHIPSVPVERSRFNFGALRNPSWEGITVQRRGSNSDGIINISTDMSSINFTSCKVLVPHFAPPELSELTLEEDKAAAVRLKTKFNELVDKYKIELGVEGRNGYPVRRLHKRRISDLSKKGDLDGAKRVKLNDDRMLLEDQRVRIVKRIKEDEKQRPKVQKRLNDTVRKTVKGTLSKRMSQLKSSEQKKRVAGLLSKHYQERKIEETRKMSELDKGEQQQLAIENQDMPVLVEGLTKEREGQKELWKEKEAERQKILEAEKEALRLEKEQQKERVVQAMKDKERKRKEMEGERKKELEQKRIETAARQAKLAEEKRLERKAEIENLKLRRAMEAQRVKEAALEEEKKAQQLRLLEEEEKMKEAERLKEIEEKERQEKEAQSLKDQEAQRLRELEWDKQRKERESKRMMERLEKGDSDDDGDVIDFFVEDDIDDLAPPEDPIASNATRYRKLY